MNKVSLTIDGVFYVIDSGMAKSKAYIHKADMDSLIVVSILQALARQNAEQAGHTRQGKMLLTLHRTCM